jgi:hypothetical protein
MTDIVDILREITETDLSWKFTYGRSDFQNLMEADSENDTSTFFFLDPVSRDPLFSPTGGSLGQTDFEGTFMILSKSELDETYDNQKETDPSLGKYKKNIKPKIESLLSNFKSKLFCNNIQILRMKSTDVINIFDDNFDGILVSFKFKMFE